MVAEARFLLRYPSSVGEILAFTGFFLALLRDHVRLSGHQAWRFPVPPLICETRLFFVAVAVAVAATEICGRIGLLRSSDDLTSSN